MKRIVASDRLVAGIILIVLPILITVLFQINVVLLLVVAGIAFIIDAFTAKPCPNGHLIYAWSRLYKNPKHCPTCGASLNEDADNSDEYYKRSSEPRATFSRERIQHNALDVSVEGG